MLFPYLACTTSVKRIYNAIIFPYFTSTAPARDFEIQRKKGRASCKRNFALLSTSPMLDIWTLSMISLARTITHHEAAVFTHTQFSRNH